MLNLRFRGLEKYWGFASLCTVLFMGVAAGSACSGPTSGDGNSGGTGAGTNSGGTGNASGAGGSGTSGAGGIGGSGVGGSSVGGSSVGGSSVGGSSVGGSAGAGGTGVGGTGAGGTGTGGVGGSSGSSGGSAGGGGMIPCDPSGTTVIANLDDSVRWPRWFAYHDDTAGGTMTPAATGPTTTFVAEASDGGYAAHAAGNGFVDYGAGIGLTVNDDGIDPACLAASTGIRVRMKGTNSVTFTAAIHQTVPTAQGGTCDNNIAGNCFNSHLVEVPLTGDWQEKTFYWTAFRQDDWDVAKKYPLYPKDLISLSWSTALMPFDFWVDDITLVSDVPDPCTGDGLCSIFSELQFNAFFSKTQHPNFTYKGFLEAAAAFPGFASTGDVDTRKRELAAFAANVSRETGMLHYIEEIMPPQTYCSDRADCACAAGKSYHGRGAIQLTWNYNYCAAAPAFGVDLRANPEVIVEQPKLAWSTGLWFWMTDNGLGTCHNAMTSGGGNFGQTIQLINGGQECGGNWGEAGQERVKHYLNYCEILGITPDPNTTC